jgi:DNA repair protein RecO (recombination protein O)
MEWEAPALVLGIRPYGEGDAVATVLTAEHGTYRGLARGGASRRHAATWLPGNVVRARWVARLSDQLGSLTAELVHAGAALAMDDALSLAVLSSACATAEGALPEREPHPYVFDGLLRLVAGLRPGEPAVAALVRWEAALLADLGYGLDLTSCAISGSMTNLAYVSPRTGRAVAAEAAGLWRERLLKLPPFLIAGEEDEGDPEAWRDGLWLTGHFLARNAFGTHNRPLPTARRLLYDQVAAHAASVAERNAAARTAHSDSLP